MMCCSIAKTNFQFELLSKLMNSQLMKYQDDVKPDFLISSKIVEQIDLPLVKPYFECKYYDLYKVDGGFIQVEFDQEHNVIGKILYQGNKAYIELTRDNLNVREYLLAEYACIYFILKNQEAIFIHSSSFKYKDKGILLIATSGTGKSTHARLWKQYEDIIQINDDKNLILFEDGKLVIYPNPFSGKHCIDTNVSSELTNLVFVHQNKVNSTKILTKKEQFLRLLPHMMNSSFMYDKDKWDRMSDRLINLTTGIDLYCDISQEAVNTLKKTLED